MHRARCFIEQKKVWCSGRKVIKVVVHTGAIVKLDDRPPIRPWVGFDAFFEQFVWEVRCVVLGVFWRVWITRALATQGVVLAGLEHTWKSV